MNIVIEYDSSVDNAPAGFKVAVQAAVAFYDRLIANPITVPILFSYGEIQNQTLGTGALGESSTNGNIETYSTVVSLLKAAATTSADMQVLNALPTTDPTNGGRFWVSDAQAQAFGLGSEPGYSDPVDGYVGLSSQYSFTYDPNNRAVPGSYDAIGVLEHEISEAIGRIGYLGTATFEGYSLYTPLDLFRYLSAGVHDLTPTAGYFSADGQTMLLPYNDPSNGADAADWASGVVGDANGDGYSGTASIVSAADILEMAALGYTLTTQQPVQSDFSGDGEADVLWQDANGQVHLWEPNLSATFGSHAIGPSAVGLTFQGSGNFSGSQVSDILWREAGGQVDLWLADATGSTFTQQNLVSVSNHWAIQPLGDFNGDGKTDILWREDTGLVQLWQSNPGTGYTGFSAQTLVGAPNNWTIDGVSDFNGDGKADILWRNDTGTVQFWLSNSGAGYTGFSGVSLAGVPTNWTVSGVGDFTGDGKADILWLSNTGAVQLWLSNPGAGYTGITAQNLAGPPNSWSVEQVSDFNGDGKADIMWRNSNGDVDIWMSNSGTGYAGFTGHDYGVVATGWHFI